MELSVFDIFKIGIGPSSSHTVGPMRAANFLLVKLKRHGLFKDTVRVRCELFGSLASTGRGHHTDRAVIWGLQGEEPETIDPDRQDELFDSVVQSNELMLGGERPIEFLFDRDIVFKPDELLPFHPNGMLFRCFDSAGDEVFTKQFYSIGGGFIVGHKTAEADQLIKDPAKVEHPFSSGDDLLHIASATGKSIAEIVLANEHAWRTTEDIEAGVERIRQTMNECIERGYRQRGELPGAFGLRRRAPALHETLTRQDEGAYGDPLGAMDWIVLYALAVNEENAAGGRVVTAPTNGAAGIVPACLRFLERFIRRLPPTAERDFLLTAGAIGMLYKTNASISGAEVGCQGEVGVACSMAAAGLAQVAGGTPEQVENAAEIGMEHNLGLTCDPIGGLVQIPCIERNAMAAVKAVNAARIALRAESKGVVSLDQVIRTMRQTGLDMQSKYKETSTGGLAINITEC
ncbi:MAG: L-serine ammonia-lyase [Acidobacteria bacterium]|uniref:L-serine dehydratase n=1 Tax=Candidatus Sulfomarinibacter kjeldsenii TaxID=2885994 RepID=A0A8J6Y7L6_9BACT|nr:L-serine ammonia-lyase [Candidatus Sulfomarinibacter kjeldsenii]